MNSWDELVAWITSGNPDIAVQGLIGLVTTALGAALGFALSQSSKHAESKRALKERRANAIAERRLKVVDQAVGLAHTLEQPVLPNGPSYHVPNITRGLESNLLLTGVDTDGLAGEAIAHFLESLHVKVVPFTVPGGDPAIELIQYIEEDNTRIWHPFVTRFVNVCQRWVEERQTGKWLNENLRSLTTELIAARRDLTGEAEGRKLLTPENVLPS